MTSLLNATFLDDLVLWLNDEVELQKLIDSCATIAISKGIGRGIELAFTPGCIEVLFKDTRIDDGCVIYEFAPLQNQSGDHLRKALANIKECYSCGDFAISTRNVRRKDYCYMCYGDCLNTPSTEEEISMEDEICVICHSELKDKSVWHMKHMDGGCIHRFHQGCIMKLRKFVCPLCRSPFKIY